MTDLIERLRDFEGSDELGNGDFSLLSEAATTIEVLREEVAGWKNIASAYAELYDEAEARAEQLVKEVEALRAEMERSERYAEQSERERLWAEARAERLAEALREAYGQVCELCDCYGHSYPEASFARYEALLREQENSND